MSMFSEIAVVESFSSYLSMVILQFMCIVLSKGRVKRRRSLNEYVRVARKWRRKLCKLAAVLQGKCTSVLVETEKNAI